MHKRLTSIAAGVILSFLLPGATPVDAVIHDITIGNNFFSPLGTRVQPGDTVRWTWVGSPLISHSSTSDPESPKSWASAVTRQAGFTFEQVFTAGDGPGPFPYHCSVHSLNMIDTIHVETVQSCCVTGGNVDGDLGGAVDVADLTLLIRYLYIDHPALSCPEEANINADALGITLADLAFLIDHLFVNFTPLPGCATSVSSFGIDNGNADTVRLVIADTQMVGSDLQVELELWFYNDSNDVVGAEAGFSWNNPNLQMDSTAETALAASSFSTTQHLLFDNTARRFQFVGYRFGGRGLVSSGSAQHVATYWMTYSNWISGDAILFDTARFENTGYEFVGSDNLLWIPEFVSQGLSGFIDSSLNIGAVGAATIETNGGVLTVSNIGSSGADGVDIALPPAKQFIGSRIGNVDLSVPDIGISFEAAGTLIPNSSGRFERRAVLPSLIGAIGIATAGGAIQLSADFTAIGDPDVTIQMYNGPLVTGSAIVPGGGLVAIGGNAGFGMPIIAAVSYSSMSPPGFTVELDRAARFTLTNSTVLVGDKIRLFAKNATGGIDALSSLKVTGAGLGFFTMSNVTLSNSGFCCLGFTGNIDCDPADFVDISDLTVLIDQLFINFPPPCCGREGNIDGDSFGLVDIADLTFLIDFLFINFTIPAPCQ